MYNLPGQLPDEKMVKVIHRDLFILFRRVLAFLLLLILLIGFSFFVQFNLPDITQAVYYPAIVLAGSALSLCIWLFFFFSFIEYYLDVWIITNERIINIEQEGFFSRTISEQRLFRVQDVTSEVKGVFPTIFSYGDVFIQTAGEKERFDFFQVPNPDQVRDLIIKLSEDDRHRAGKELMIEERELV